MWDAVILMALYALFLVPVVLRVRARPIPQAELREALRHPGRIPAGVWVHTAGGLLIGAAAATAAAGGRVGPAASVRAAVGTVALVLAAALGAWALSALRSWRLLPRLDENHELCTTGPYAWVGHPVHVAIALEGIGSALWVPEWGVIAGALLLQHRDAMSRFGSGLKPIEASSRQLT